MKSLLTIFCLPLCEYMDNFFEHNIGFNEYITGNRFIDICSDSGNEFCKTDFLRIHNTKKYKSFVTHNSDYHIDQQRYLTGPKADRWYCQNKDVDHDNLISIPIGLENMTLRSDNKRYAHHSSEVKNALIKANIIDRYSGFHLSKNNLVYMNFNTNTYPIERKHVWNKFSKDPWITKASNLSMEKFYFDVASSKFIISPRGNGVDCHRTWEALYLRAIPIVRRSTHMKEFEDLPIFFVDNWDKVCYNTLLEFYEKVKTKLFNLDKMKISYWRERISNE